MHSGLAISVRVGQFSQVGHFSQCVNGGVELIIEVKTIKVFLMSVCWLGFKEQIYDVYRYLPPATQVVLLSATLPHEILEMTQKFMTDPVRILVKR